MSVKTMGGIIAGLLVMVIGGYFVISGSPEDLLNADKLSPKQIRIVATRLLIHDDVKIRAQASEKLTAQGAAAVPVLKGIGVTDSNLELRLAVFGVLAGMDGNAAADILDSLMTDEDPEVRQRAVSAAGYLSHPRAVAVMTKGLGDQESFVRSTAAGTLGTAGASSAIPALRAALNDPELPVRKHAARSLKELTGHDYSYNK